MSDTTTQRIHAVTVEWLDGTDTRFLKQPDGSWKSTGLTTQGPQGMLEHIAMWVENSYREDGR